MSMAEDHTEATLAIKVLPATTFFATRPAYTYRSLCPDRRLGKAPGRRLEHLRGTKAQVTKRKVTQAYTRDGTQL